MKNYLLFISVLSLFSCKKDDTTTAAGPQMTFQFQFDATQARLNNVGNPSTIPTGNAAQTPDFKALSVHYIELAQDKFTLLGKGAIVYKGAETTKGGDNAADFDKAAVRKTVEKSLNRYTGSSKKQVYHLKSLGQY